MISVEATWDKRALGAMLARGGVAKATARALRKAGSTALRDMRSEANKRVRARKRIKASYIRKALSIRRPPRVSIDTTWAVDVSGGQVPLIAYPYTERKRDAQGRDRKGRFREFAPKARRGGVTVEVNRGKRTLLPHAFVATMRSGHKGIFERLGKGRLPIKERLGSRPVDALLHRGEAEGVAERGRRVLVETFTRLLPLEVAKVEG